MDSYEGLNAIAEYAFPCVDGLGKGYLSETYNEKNYWELPKTRDTDNGLDEELIQEYLDN